MAILKLASVPEARGLIPDFVRASLPFDPEHEGRWEKMKEFFMHSDVWARPVDHPFAYDQLRLVAEGYRDLRLHRASQETLPLHD